MRIRQIPQWIRNRLSLGGLILIYHRVARCTPDPFSLCVTPERFSEHLTLLKERASVVPLDVIAERVRRRQSSRGLVAITFDDGYEDNFTEALPLLERFQIPATFFVVARRDRPFWWDRLDVYEPSSYARLQRIADEERWLELPEPDRPSPSRMTDEQLAAAARSPLITIGAHTVTHPLLSSLTRERQRDEIAAGRVRLEEAIGKPIHCFAYPYGGEGSFDQVTRELVRAEGYRYAVAASSNLVTRGTDPFAIPRIAVQQDSTLVTYARWLRKGSRARELS